MQNPYISQRSKELTANSEVAPLYRRVDKVIAKKEKNLELRKREIEAKRAHDLNTNGEMTEE